MASVSDLLSAISALSSAIDALIAKIQPAQDLQPVSDALAAVKAKVDAALSA